MIVEGAELLLVGRVSLPIATPVGVGWDAGTILLGIRLLGSYPSLAQVETSTGPIHPLWAS